MKMGNIFSAFLFMVSPGVFAATDADCKAYANNALQQLQQARSIGVPNLDPPTWVDDYNAHYNWCMPLPKMIADMASAQRQQIIDQHQASPSAAPPSSPAVGRGPGTGALQDVCQQYADTALKQLHEAQSLGMPDLNPPVWSTNHQGHQDWCMHVGEAKANGGTAMRNALLDKYRVNKDPAKKAFCEKYAEDAANQFRSAKSIGMTNLQPPVWSIDVNGHFNWCVRVDEGQAMGGLAMRDAQIREHQAKKYPDHHAMCDKYAKTATGQFRQAQSLGVTELKSPPTWSDDYNVHYKECAGRYVQAAADKMTARRNGILNQYRASKSPEKDPSCREYARTAVDQFHQAKKRGLSGINPPIWSEDYNGHYAWCINVDSEMAINGTAIRQDILENQGWTRCADEGGVCETGGFFFDGPDNGRPVFVLREVRYGADGNYIYGYFADAQVHCSNKGFRKDPISSVKKHCDVSNKSVTVEGKGDWGFVANEGNSWVINEPVIVRYGADGRYLYRLFVRSGLLEKPDSGKCNNKTFGGDPAPKITKHCYAKPLDTGGVLAHNRSQKDWEFCKNENAQCWFPGIKWVRFGAEGNYVYNLLQDNLFCTCRIGELPCPPNTDPAPGITKHCYIADPVSKGGGWGQGSAKPSGTWPDKIL